MKQPFQPDETVDIVIRGALVDHHCPHMLTVSIPGVDQQVEIPLSDDDGGPLPAVKVTRTGIFSGGAE